MPESSPYSGQSKCVKVGFESEQSRSQAEALMSDPAARETITLVIGKSEALVLFEFLADFHRQASLGINDNAERLALVRLHGALESTLVELFSPHYSKIIAAARNDLTRQWGDSATGVPSSD